MKHIVMEIDEVAVPGDTLEQARAGSNAARKKLRSWLEGVTLKKGRAQIEETYAVTNLRELSMMGLIDTIIIGGENITEVL